MAASLELAKNGGHPPPNPLPSREGEIRWANTWFAPTGPMHVVDSITKSAKNRRRSIRLHGWAYSQEGVYFITVCTQNREYFFGEIIDGLMNLNAPGQMVVQTWEELPERFPCMEINASVVMPNHFHAIAIINRRGESCIRRDQFLSRRGDPCDRPAFLQGEQEVRSYGKRPQGTSEESIGRIVRALKSITTHKYIQGVREYGWRRFQGKL